MDGFGHVVKSQCSEAGGIVALTDRCATWRKRIPSLAGKPGSVCMVMLSTGNPVSIVGGQ